MPDKLIEIRTGSRKKVYTVTTAARIVRVPVEFVDECERENLIQPKIVHGQKGYDDEAVRRLIRIRHLIRDLGFDLNAVDCILRMRRQIMSLQEELKIIEERMCQREQEMLKEIENLRDRLAQKNKW